MKTWKIRQVLFNNIFTKSINFQFCINSKVYCDKFLCLEFRFKIYFEKWKLLLGIKLEFLNKCFRF